MNRQNHSCGVLNPVRRLPAGKFAYLLCSERGSLLPEQLRRLDPRDPPCRHVAGDDGDEGQARGHDTQSQRVKGRKAHEYPTEYASRVVDPRNTDEQSEQDQPEHLAALGAEGHVHGELVAPAGHRPGDHAVEPHATVVLGSV